MKGTHITALASVIILASCRGPEVKQSATEALAPSIAALEVRTAAVGDAGWQSVMPGTALSSGADFAVNVTVGQAAYVYIAQRSANGDVTLVFPVFNQQAGPHSAGKTISIPAEGQWFRLDDRLGEETLLALVSTQPQELVSAQRILAERGDSACVKTRDPPPPEVKNRDRGSLLYAVMGSDGTAVICFPFRHR